MTTYYVSPTGSDTNTGLTLTTAWKSLRKASSTIAAGDTILVNDGLYYETLSTYFNSLQATASAPTVVRALPGAKPIFKYPSGKEGCAFSSCSYFVLEGLSFVGDADNVTYSDAYANKDSYYAVKDCDGLTVKSLSSTPTVFSHHFTIQHCSVSKFPGAGILLIDTDFATVDACESAYNSFYSMYGTQGISVLCASNYDATLTGVDRIKVTNCRSHGNKNLIPWSTAVGGNGQINEGHGIVLDTAKRNRANTASFTGNILVSSNVCYNNGGAGIQLLQTNRVTATDNYCYHNNTVLDVSELLVNYGDSYNVYSNYVGAKSTKKWNTTKYCTNSSVTGNFIEGTTLSSAVNNTNVTLTPNTFS